MLRKVMLFMCFMFVSYTLSLYPLVYDFNLKPSDFFDVGSLIISAVVATIIMVLRHDLFLAKK